MPSIGTIPVTTYRSETDSMEYALAGNSVSNTDLLAFRRTLPAAKPGALDPGVLRSNVRGQRTVTVGELKKMMTMNVSFVVPVGTESTDIDDYITDVLIPTVQSTAFAALAKAGDIYVAD